MGTSGWQYRDWAHDFYADSPSRTWLRIYAERLDSIEVNRTFYREVRPGTVETWKRETPLGFGFSLKAHRYLTHVKRLLFEPESLNRQKTAASLLGEKLSAVLWQLPPGLHHDPSRLGRFLTQLREWQEVPHAIEFRHSSWFRDSVAEALATDGHAVCFSDAGNWPLWDKVTARHVYVRLHGREDTYRSAYSDSELACWVERIDQWRAAGRAVLVYFDNTDRGAAWRNALTLKNMLGL